MVNHTLLPEQDNLTIEKVGGPGHEFDVFGKNFPNSWEKKEDVREQGAWRIQASPQKAEETDYFLNVMQVKDINGREPLTPQKLESAQMIGTKIKDRVVLFSKSGERLKESGTFEVNGENEVITFLVCDLTEGTWRVEKNGNVSIHRVSEEGGVLSFGGAAGNYKLTYT